MTGPANVDALCTEAAAAFEIYRETDATQRAQLLERIADEIMALGSHLIETAARESRLHAARIESERGRTVGQLRMFADVLRQGSWMRLRVDPALPERQPAPRPDLRLRWIAIGPVAVFGASNFPLAFSTAGGDTVSALAAGCPVVFKLHPAHPETSSLVSEAIAKALAACGLPSGVFGHLSDGSNDAGTALVANSKIAAVAFTGSRAGGLALCRLAQARNNPVPVFAEMSSINPVLLLPDALAKRPQILAQEFVASMTLGAGQFCTNPGMVLAMQGPGLDAFLSYAAESLRHVPAAPMLTSRIHALYAEGVAALAAHRDVQLLAHGQAGAEPDSCQAGLFVTGADSVLADPKLAEEVFGAASVVVRCESEDQLLEVLNSLEGQLTTTLHLDEQDFSLASRIVPLLERKAGRIIANGWPTGVEVTHAQVHGGPFPATSQPQSTSVGSLAIERFLRPVCYQNLPVDLLPDVLRDSDLSTLPHQMEGIPK